MVNKVLDQNAMPGMLEYTEEQMPKASWHSWLIGRPLATADAPHQTIGNWSGWRFFHQMRFRLSRMGRRKP